MAGKGGAGAVYKARDRDTGRTVALKIIAGSTSGGAMGRSSVTFSASDTNTFYATLRTGTGDVTITGTSRSWTKWNCTFWRVVRWPQPREKVSEM